MVEISIQPRECDPRCSEGCSRILKTTNPQCGNRVKTASCRLPVKDVVRLPVTSHETESNVESNLFTGSTTCTVFIQAVPVCWCVSELVRAVPAKDIVRHPVKLPSASQTTSYNITQIRTYVATFDSHWRCVGVSQSLIKRLAVIFDWEARLMEFPGPWSACCLLNSL